MTVGKAVPVSLKNFEEIKDMKRDYYPHYFTFQSELEGDKKLLFDTVFPLWQQHARYIMESPIGTLLEDTYAKIKIYKNMTAKFVNVKANQDLRVLGQYVYQWQAFEFELPDYFNEQAIEMFGEEYVRQMHKNSNKRKKK